ncbi:MAG: hypothetical protein ACR2P5_09445 [Gammaproteobacteria bacterium]
MGVILAMRAKEEVLRGKNRSSRRETAAREDILRDNDATVAVLHRLSLLLIARKTGWQRQAEILLRRGFKAAECNIAVFGPRDALAVKASRLPAGGRADDAPLSGAQKKAALYYHLPLKQGRRAAGLLTLAFRQKEHLREGDDIFCRRLAALLAAAL